MIQILKVLGIIIFGQSNSIGTKRVAGNLPSDLAGVRRGQFSYIDSWQQLEAGVSNSGKDPNNTYYSGRYGFEMRLMQLVYDYFNIDIRMVKFGRGGIPLAQQTGSLNDWHPNSLNEYYQQSNTHLNSAIAAVDFPINFLCEIWVQAEQDASLNRTQSEYRGDQILLFNSRRSAIGYDIAFIDVSLSMGQTAISSGQRNEINNAKYDIAEYVYDSATKILTKKTGTYVIDNVWLIQQNEPTDAYYQEDDGSLSTSDNVHYTPVGTNNIANYIFEVITHPKFQIG